MITNVTITTIIYAAFLHVTSARQFNIIIIIVYNDGIWQCLLIVTGNFTSNHELKLSLHTVFGILQLCHVIIP